MTRPERYERVLTISERVYKALLTVYPKEFRDEYGLQMMQVFRDLCQEKLDCGGVAGFVGLWERTVLDLATTALAQRSSNRVNDEEVVIPIKIIDVPTTRRLPPTRRNRLGSAIGTGPASRAPAPP
jgi:hypothetical protein